MNVMFRWMLVLLLVVGLPTAALAAEEDEAKATQAAAEIGYWDASVDGSPDLAAEYEPVEGGPDVRVKVDTVKDNGSSILFYGKYRAEEDQDYVLNFDVKRTFRSTNTLNTLLHRLGHQPVEHFETATNHGRVVYNTDMDPDSEYQIDYTLFEGRSEFQPKGTSGLTLGLDYRWQQRDGLEQQTNISHCDACHVVSQDRPIEETTSDIGFDAQYAWGKGQARASYRTRKLEQDPTNITLLFDDALHPELRAPVFDNRVQYDLQSGAQPIDVRPDSTKDFLRLDFLFTDVGGFNLNAEGVWTETTNDYTGLSSDFNGYMASAARRLGKKWNFRWRGRLYSMANDDVFVDTNEPVGIAGPQAGKTYREIYGFDPDFTRKSALERDVVESKLDFTYRMGGKLGRARFFWNYEDVDRKNYEVAPGETASSTNVLGASWWLRPARGWKMNLGYEHGETSNPFNIVDGQYSTLVSGPAPNPFVPEAAQYYVSHEARVAEGSASPESWDEFTLRASYTKGNNMLSGSYRYWDGSNASGDLMDWTRQAQSIALMFWSTPAAKWQYHLGYNFNSSESQTPASIPLFDG